MIYIYALIDPETKEIRYIGKSIRPRERLVSHCNERARTWRNNWIRQVLDVGRAVAALADAPTEQRSLLDTLEPATT